MNDEAQKRREVTNGVRILFGMLVDELDRGGAISKKDFRERLLKAARHGDETRWDVQLLRVVAADIESAAPTWSPTVIKGGIE